MNRLGLYDRDHEQRINAFIGVEAGPRIAAARNQVVRMFLELPDKPEWFNWFDVDMVPPPDYLERLHAAADPETAPIVGALCFAGGRTKVVPTIYTIENTDGKMQSETQLSYPADAVIEVGGTGSACLLIHRSVFENVLEGITKVQPDHPLPWYQDVLVDNKDWGEDLIFCLRARAAGARIWIDTGCKVGHRKMWTMDERAFVAYAGELDRLANEEHIVYNAESLPHVDIAELVPVGGA